MIAALAIAFFLNIARVAVLIVTVIHSDKAGFIFWHKNTGAHLFEAASVVSFVLFYRFVILNPGKPVQKTTGEEV